MILDSADKAISAEILEAYSETSLDCIVCWYDQNKDLNFTETVGREIENTIQSIIPGNANGYRTVRSINVFNADTINHTIQFYYTDGTEHKKLFKCTLQPGWTIEYVVNRGWAIYGW